MYYTNDGMNLYIGDMVQGDREATTEEVVQYEAQQLEASKPKVITPLQARLALNEMLLRQAVETEMLTATQDVKDFYEFALEWKRDYAPLLAMATSLGMDSVAIDNFFLLASTK